MNRCHHAALFSRTGLLPALALLLAPCLAHGAGVLFSSTSATFEQAAPHHAGAAIDGVLSGDNGWSVLGGQFTAQSAVFRCVAPVDASTLLVTLVHASPNADQHLNEFQLFATSDANPALDGGNWTPLAPLQATSTTTALAITNGRVRSSGSAVTARFQVVANTPFSGITGFRLDAFPFDFEPADALVASLGRAANGNFTLTEFQVEAEPLANIALGKPVTASAAMWGGFVASSLTDGDPNTFTHPLAGSGTLGYYFQVDLGRVYRLDRLVLRNRADGCCPERLRNYRVELYADSGGAPGALNWAAGVRTNGTYSGVAGLDTVTATNSPTGTFAGRFVRVVNLSNEAYNPQVAEIEAFGALAPTIRAFAVDDDTLAAGQTATMSWLILNATSASISPGIGAVAATSGSRLITPNVTTTYTLTASNDAGLSVATVIVGVNVTLAPPQISEFLADNAGNLKDEDGDSPDWIELRNPNPFHLELGGYFLTDDPTNRTKWPCPNARLAPNGYGIVFASGNDRRDPQAELHTSFKLDAKGDYLALVDRDGTSVLQQFPANYPATNQFPRQRQNVSYGSGFTGGTGFLRPPTPGAANGPAFEGVVSDTSFSLDRGFYDTNISVTITTATPGAVIRYTLNRSEPTATSGSIYTNAIRITNTTVLRAAAFRANWAPTDVDTHTYLFLSNVIASSVMSTGITRDAVYGPQMRAALLDAPSMSLVTASAPNDTTEVRASVEWLRPDGLPGFQEDCGVIQYGGAFSQFDKESFRLQFRSEYGAGKLKYPLFDGHAHGLAAVESFDAIELRNGSHDMAMRGFYMSNPFTDDTLLEMGRLNPHGRFVHVYLNGAYWGLYHLRERWHAAMHQSYLGGAGENYESINGNWNVGGWADPGVPYDGDGSSWARIKSLRTSYAAVKPYLDVPEYVDYMLVFMFGGCEEEYRCVGPTGPGSGFKFYLNDADGWFCGPWYCASGDRTGRAAPGRSVGDGPGSVFSMLFAEGNPDYRTLLADRIQAALFSNGTLTPSRNAARLNERCNQIQRAFLAESARWSYLSPSDWASRRAYALNTWLPTRTAQALSEWRRAGFYPSLDAPTLNQQGGLVPANFQVAFTGPASGTIYYTIDGGDPRLPGGAVKPNARVFSSDGGVGETVIATGSRWRWWAEGTGLGASDVVVGHPGWSAANWKHANFNDAAWNEGPAQFGYGEGDEATPIPSGLSANAKWITSYYRHRFQVPDPAGIVALTLRLKRDDGAVIYLNGVEAARSSMLVGLVTDATLALTASDDGQGFNVITLAPSLLLAGTNIMAVELHQASPSTSDASFDLELVAARTNAVIDAPLRLTRNTVLKCRTKDATQWSALNEAFFQVGPSALDPGEVLVSELNFNPRGSDATEFVELANVSARAVNLRGARLNGIDYAFPDNRDTLLASGQRLVLVNDLFQFQQRYGLEVPVAGVYSGSLDNGGERLTLLDGASNVITSFRYEGAHPWPVGADGAGYTLVLSHPELGVTNATAWRTSATTNGSPGGTDATAFTANPALDGDGDGLPALVEYALGTSDADPASGPGAIRAGVDAAGRFFVTFPRNLRADDVTLAVEASEDLSIWFPAALFSTRTNPDGTATATWGVPVAGLEQSFLRVQVRRP